MNNWQSIETAPKDGRWIWVKRDPPVDGRLVLSVFMWDETHNGWFAGTGWWPQFPMAFTHWMLLSDPPEIT